MIAVFLIIHATNSVEGHKAISKWLGLMIPFLASIDIIRKIGSKSISYLGSSVSVASDTFIANVSMRNSIIELFNLKSHQQGDK